MPAVSGSNDANSQKRMLQGVTVCLREKVIRNLSANPEGMNPMIASVFHMPFFPYSQPIPKERNPMPPAYCILAFLGFILSHPSYRQFSLTSQRFLAEAGEMKKKIARTVSRVLKFNHFIIITVFVNFEM